MIKKIIFFIVLISMTNNIMPMLSAYVCCCLDLGCSIPEENKCLKIDLCCVGCAIGCPYPIRAVNNADSNSISDISSCRNDDGSDISASEDLGNINFDSIDIPRIGMFQEKACTAVVSLQPGVPGIISHKNNKAAGHTPKDYDKAIQKMVANTYNGPKKAKGYSYSYAYYSETIETPSQYSKRTVKIVSTPGGRKETRSEFVAMSDPRQQSRSNGEYHTQTPGGPIITEMD